MEEVKFIALRSFDDFIGSGARFAMPDVKDAVRVNNRMVNNLLYYQSNYFLMAVIIFIVIGILHPIDILLGCFTLSVAFVGVTYASNSQHNLKQIKQQHPLLSIGVVLSLCYVVLYFAGSVLVFVFGIAVPLAACLIHSALRVRNMKNKVSNRFEFVGLKRTPMGLILEALGQESEAGS